MSKETPMQYDDHILTLVDMYSDLPLNFRPAATGARLVFITR